jgi:hypothetical protein
VTVADEPVAWADGTITVAGRWTYHWGATRRPFVHPLTTPAGTTLTVDAPDDHPWHHALWFAIKYVNGDNYWEEISPYGVLRHRDDPPLVAAASDDAISVGGFLDWVAPDRTTVVLRERRTLTHRPRSAEYYALDVEIELTPHLDVVLDRTPFNGDWGGYGGLTFRGRPELVDSTLLLAEGAPTDRVTGQRAAWLHLEGRVDGQPVGVALFDAPTNPTHPVPWYASTRAANYGDGWANFVNAAFLWEEPRNVAAGDTLRLDYRVVVHDGSWSGARVEDEWQAYRSGFLD